MKRAYIVHWKAAEAGPLIEACRAGGFEPVSSAEPTGPNVTREIRATPPDAVVIDLSRLPSHGREIGLWLRATKATRHIPIVFANGEPAKIEAVKKLLPDALFTTTAEGISAKRVKGPAKPVIPAPMMDRFKARTAAQKLGVVANGTVGLIDPPRGWASFLGELPEGVEAIEDPAAPQEVTLWFVHDAPGLSSALRPMRAVASKTKLWIVWRKGKVNGISENLIREQGIATGLVDYKICSIDAVWSAMAFALKKA